MIAATYEDVLQGTRQLTPAEQHRLIEALEDLDAVRAYDAAVAAQSTEELIPLDQAIAEIEAEWAAADQPV